VAAQVSDAPWDGDASRFTDQQWQTSCLLDRGAKMTSAKMRYALPVREPDGTLNRRAMAAASAVLGGARGGVIASPAAKAAAQRKLKALYQQAGLEKRAKALGLIA
jgi:hypothetical protein